MVRKGVVVARLLLAAALGAALVASVVSRSPGPNGFIDFLAYLPTQVTLIGIAALVAGSVALLRGGPTPGWIVALRGAAVTYGIVLAMARLLIALPWQTSGGFPLPLANVLLTMVAPLLLALDWVIVGDRYALTPSFLRWIAAYPLLWSTFTLLRGIQTGWTPYPLLNPSVAGVRLPIYLTATVLLALAAGSITSWLSRQPAWVPFHQDEDEVPGVSRLIGEPRGAARPDRPARRRVQPGGPADAADPATGEPSEDQGRV